MQKTQNEPKQIADLNFFGVHIEQVADGVIMDHENCISSFPRCVSIKADQGILRKLRGNLSWCVYATRPDLACYWAKPSQVQKRRVKNTETRLLSKVVKLLKNQNVLLILRRLDLDTLRIAVYTDAGFASNWDQTSQLGFVLVFNDARRKCSIIRWSSYKSHRSQGPS